MGTMKVKSVTILILGIIFIDVLAADDYSTEYKSHTDNYDITAIYKTTSTYDAGEKGKGNAFNNSQCIECYDVTIHLRTNAIGMPIEFNGRILSSDKKSLEFIADQTFQTSNILTRNEVEYNVENWAISTYFMDNKSDDEKSYNLLLWKADDHTESFKIKWKQRNTVQTCISVSYLLEDASQCTFAMHLVHEDSPDKQVILYSRDNITESKKLQTVLFKSNNLLNENQSYSLNIKLQKTSKQVVVENERYNSFSWDEEYFVSKTVYADNCKVGIKRIAQCQDEYDENEETLEITAKDLQKTPSAFNVYPFDYTPQKNSVWLSSTCLNGGFEFKNGCACPPGFRGDNCEHGCGPNAYGADCTGMCSMRKTHCRQMMICTNDFGCKCPAGFSGDDCTTECTSGTYGVNCEQQCSEGCISKLCDVYTGVCNSGCATNYITPDCIEKYPWLNYPPQLLQESLDFTSLKLKIDLNSENINGSTNVNPVYYQIIFKAAQSESDFQYLDFKEIGQQKSVLETIDSLQPGLLYSFGAILISEDGNYNIDDAKMVNYSTKCILSNNIKHDVKLLSGADHINIIWNQLHRDQHDNECKITNYLLKLMHNHTIIEEHSYSAIAKSFDDSHQYIFENIVSDEKYAVHLTGKLSTGQTIPLNTSYIYTMPHGFVQIKNIKAKHGQNSSMIVTWEVDERHKNTPLSYTVKYKVNKYFSCSHKVVTNDWISLSVYNQTKCNIVDLTPNTQYVIKVDPTVEGYNYKDQANIIFVKTNISTPQLMPVFNYENGAYITYESAYFNWTINMTAECSKLNGFFRGYHVVLEDITVNSTQVAKSTKQNNVNYDGLKTDTNYILHIYVETNYGINKEQGLSIPFKTKSEISVPVDLTVYKKDLVHKSIGIRWSCPDKHIDAFIISTIDKNIKNLARQNITMTPKRCVVWSNYYCAEIDKLIPNHRYTIEVRTITKDYLTGGLPASVESKFTEGFPDTPKNLIKKDVNSTSITLEWDIPWTFDGVLKSFIVYTEEISSKDDKCCSDIRSNVEIPITEETPTYNYTINDLKPGSTYLIGVSSSIHQLNIINVTMPLDAATTPTTPPETTSLPSPNNSTKL